MHYSNCSQVMQSVKFPFIHLHTILSHQLSHGHIFSVEKLKLTQCIGLYMIMNCKIMEGFHAITAYIAFLFFFNMLISRKRSANQQKQLRNDVFHVKTSPSAKNKPEAAKKNRFKKQHKPFLLESIQTCS